MQEPQTIANLEDTFYDNEQTYFASVYMAKNMYKLLKNHGPKSLGLGLHFFQKSMLSY
jgi:hypothetical protein